MPHPAGGANLLGMGNLLRMAWHLLLGRRRLWQYYTNVTWSTCEECLRLHGRIAPRPELLPNPGHRCPRELLPFPVRELPAYRQKAQLMRRVAQEELLRRRLFREAQEALLTEPDRALALFDQAGAVDVFLPELERLAGTVGPALSPDLRARLQEVFLRRWGEKFFKPRYQVLPERMREARERWGEKRIKELFGGG